MRVILLEDLPSLGKKFEIKEVKAGFARNFLFPKKLALPVNPKTKKWFKKIIQESQKKEEEKLRKIQEIKKLEVKISVGEKGEVFEKVSKNRIFKLLKERGLEINKENILLKKPLEKLGTHKVNIQFGGRIFEIEVELKPKNK